MSNSMCSNRRVIVHNSFALAAMQAANLLLPLVTLPYLLRVLGPEHFGIYSFSQAVLAYGVVFADYGFNLSATQRIAQAQGQIEIISRLFWSIQAAKLLLILAASLFMGLLIWSVPQFSAVWPVMLASAPVMLGSLLFPQWLFQGLEQMWLISFCTIIARASVIPLIFWMVQGIEDTWVAALILACGPVIAGLIACGIIWRRKLVGWMRPCWREVRQALADGWHLFMSTTAISLYTNANPMLLGLLNGHVAVGIFNAADKIRVACQSLSTPLSLAVYPRVNALMSRDPRAGLALARKLLLIQGGAMLLLSCLLWLLAPWAVQLIMGPQFDAAVSVLRILAPLPFIIGLSNVFGVQIMLPLGMKKSFSRIVLASGLINITLVILLAPRWEADGVAMAVLVTECIVTLLMAWALFRADVSLFTCQSPTLSRQHEI